MLFHAADSVIDSWEVPPPPLPSANEAAERGRAFSGVLWLEPGLVKGAYCAHVTDGTSTSCCCATALKDKPAVRSAPVRLGPHASALGTQGEEEVRAVRSARIVLGSVMLQHAAQKHVYANGDARLLPRVRFDDGL